MTRDARTGYDVVVVGGGSAGCVLANRLSADAARRVLLVEAGPDYADRSRLPADIADGWELPGSHGWGFRSDPGAGGRTLDLPRGRLTGGCSAINACIALRGWTAGDAWDVPGWSFADVLPHFRAAETDADFADEWHGRDGPLPVARAGRAERTVLHEAFLQACAALGYPDVEDHNRPGALGAGPLPMNLVDGVRMSTALTYLAAARDRPNLEVRGGETVDRLVLDGGRARGVVLAAPGGAVESDLVVLAAGSYGTPAILLRSGVGPAADLPELGIAVSVDLPGVGRGLVEHPIASVDAPTTLPVSHGPKYQVMAGLRSTLAGPRPGPDVHLFPCGPWDGGPAGPVLAVVCAVLDPRSRGWLRLRSADPAAAPRIDPCLLDHPDDRRRMVESLREARRLLRTPPLSGLVAGPEVQPGEQVQSDEALTAWARSACQTYHHPVGTCRMGADSDPEAVVDGRGRVRGLDGVVVGDASVIPLIPTAGTNLTTIMVAERIAALLSAAADLP